MHNNIRKIAVIGCGGSGKTTLAKQLATLFKLPLYHLDKYYWKPGWQKININEFIPIHRSIYEQSHWIIDGNQTHVMRERLHHADMIIFLDKPRWLCLWRVTKRWLKYRNTYRDDLHDGCKDRLTWGFLRYIWFFNYRFKPKIIKLLDELKSEKKIYILTSNSDIKNWLVRLQEQKTL